MHAGVTHSLSAVTALGHTLILAPGAATAAAGAYSLGYRATDCQTCLLRICGSRQIHLSMVYATIAVSISLRSAAIAQC
jgi:hypothetical protein